MVEVRAYLRKAQEYLAAASDCLAAGRLDAATSAAIHAGINAADAICGARSGVRSSSPNHARTIDLLESAGPDGVDGARQLRKLLPLKNLAEYDYAATTRQRATTALRAALAIVDIARRVAAAP